MLEDVRDELGDDVRIVAANRVRKGGLGGFFAREYFEVIADEPEPLQPEADVRPPVRLGRRRSDAAAETAAASRSVPRSVLDLVEERNHEERIMRAIDLDEMDQLEALGARDQIDARHMTDIDLDPDLDDGDEYVTDDVIHVEGPTHDVGAATPQLSTETERFAQILERLAHSTEHHPVPAAPRPPRPERPAVALAERASAEPLVHAGAAHYTAVAPVSMQASVPAATAVAVAQMPAPTPQDDVVSLVDTERAQAAAQARAAHLAYTATEDGAEETIERPEQVLVRLGLPARYVPRGAAGGALRSALIESLTRLPQADALPDAKGVVIAVVGIGARPVLLARAVSTELGLDPDEVVVATQTEIDGVPAWLQITEPAAADERRRSWRRRDQLTFVALSQPAVTAATSWTSAMLDKLEPTQLWGLASAGWKPEDVDAWSQRLGGFDLVALDRLVDTVSPASMLSLGIPIGRLDNTVATPQQWAEVLLDRVLVS